jgi:hypothetical protein
VKAALAPATASPLGVHIYADGVAVVEVQKHNGLPTLKRFAMCPISASAGRPLRDLQIDALRTCCEQVEGASKSCILSVLATQVLTRRFELPKNARARAVQSAAEIEADRLTKWTPEERILSVDRLPNSNERLLTVSKREVVSGLVDIASAADLQAVAVDAPLTAWQRSMPSVDADAILDLSSHRPALYVSADPIGEQALFAGAMDADALADAVRSALIDLRTKQRLEARRLRIFGSHSEMPRLIQLLMLDAGLDVSLLTLGRAENPPWAYALALATWPFAGTQRGSH